ncbi:MAG: thioesterase family protein [Planctomycetales bacterium]
MTRPIAHEIEFRVRYADTDAMGFLHHANYFDYFEVGRTELFRAMGGDYRAMEEAGRFLVVVDISCKYKRPARFDDMLRLRTTLAEVTPAKLIHEYELFRGDEPLAAARSVLACVDRAGRVQRMPDGLPGKPQ